MAANDREFTLIGKFDDQITKKLKEINETVSKLNKPLPRDNFTKSVTDGFTAANKELGVLQKHLETISKFQMKFDKSGITAAKEEAEALGRTIRDVEKAGFQFDRSGLKAAQEDANVLGEILKANALIKVGEGFANALTTGAMSAVSILQKGAGFFGGQFRSAVQDQMEDLQARGSLFGALTKQGILKGGTATEMEEGYRQTKIISRANEQAIGELIRTSSVSTGVVTTLNRQMTDNLLPTLLKARGITSLSGLSRDEMDKIFGGEKGVGQELARTYEKIATIIPSPQYASMSAMGFTQVIAQGTINKQLAVFENNPVLVDALRTIDGGIQGTSDIGKRIQILQKALEVAAPTMMLEEMRMTIGGGFQAVQDTIMNPTVGILSLGADIANEGRRTLAQYKATQADEIQRDRIIRNLNELADKRKLEGTARREFIAKYEKIQMDKLYEAIENADSPIEKISVALAPVLQSFASFINTFGNLFLGPVTSAMDALYGPMAALQRTLDYLATDIELFNTSGGKEGRSIGEALGRAFAEIFKTLASYFNPQKAGKEIGDGINTFFDDFMKGFKSDKIDGEKYLKIVMDTLQSIIMKMLFKNGDITQGMTGLGDALVKVFALLAAPAFVSALISGLVPVAIMYMHGMLKAVFKALGAKIKSAGGLGSVLSRQAATSAQAGSALPGMAKPLAFAKGVKMKGVSTLAAAIIAFSTHAPGLEKAGKAVMSVGKRIPLLSVAFAGLDFAAQKAEGKSTAQAGLSAGGGFIGGIAGAAIGQTLIPIPGVGAVAGGFIGSFLGSWLGEQLGKMGPALGGAFNSLKTMLYNLPGNIVNAIGYAIGYMEGSWARFSSWFMGLGPKLAEWAANARATLSTEWTRFMWQIRAVIANPGKYIVGAAESLGNAIGNAIKRAFASAGEKLSNFGQWIEEQKRNFARSRAQGRTAAVGAGLGEEKAEGRAFGSANPFMGTLGEAINFEMANKPAGSHLVIANSSETVIPAAGGFGDGLQGLISAIWGAAQMTTGNITKAVERGSTVTQSTLGQGFTNVAQMTARSMEISSRENTQILQAIRAAAAAGGFGMGAGGLGNVPGGLSAAAALAQSFGLSLTSFQRSGPASESYHNVGRAMDFSNGSGPTPQMMAFAQHMVRRHGSRLTELFYTPLGFSIKHGQRVAPIAAGTHYDHVHVAYALGSTKPAFFKSAKAADAWEASMAPNEPIISSVRATASEVGRGSVTINAPITIYQQPGQDAEQVAKLAAIKIAMAVNEVRNHM